ncbi:MAG: hypothetical protein K2L28_05740 [Muribaculaceae bacterium]|nr:hypothetical protein [Muribaculaceae bacterium]
METESEFDEKNIAKCLVISEIIANFAALNSALARCCVVNSLMVSAMGGL